MNVVEKAKEARDDLELRIHKMCYMHLVYTRINKMSSTEDSDTQLRLLTGALAEGIKIALGILGVEPDGQTQVPEAQIQQDVNKILDELQVQFSKDSTKL